MLYKPVHVAPMEVWIPKIHMIGISTILDLAKIIHIKLT
jgi:hypothetical protein